MWPDGQLRFLIDKQKEDNEDFIILVGKEKNFLEECHLKNKLSFQN